MIDYDPQTGCDDGYDEAIKWCIEEVIGEIHRIKELDKLSVEAVYYALFNQEVEEAYKEYLRECKEP
jgi:hypothetical protein